MAGDLPCVKIDSATVSDALAIAEIQVAGVNTAYSDLIPASQAAPILEAANPKRRAGSWRLWLTRAQTSTFVARVGETPVGFCTLHPCRDTKADHGTTGEIAALFVLPSYWRQGVGRQLCERTAAEAAARRLAELTLWVLDKNTRARQFYEALGFRADGTRKVFLQSGATALYDLRYRRSSMPRASEVHVDP